MVWFRNIQALGFESYMLVMGFSPIKIEGFDRWDPPPGQNDQNISHLHPTLYMLGLHTVPFDFRSVRLSVMPNSLQPHGL